jgi:hypothetical protein
MIIRVLQILQGYIWIVDCRARNNYLLYPSWALSSACERQQNANILL